MNKDRYIADTYVSMIAQHEARKAEERANRKPLSEFTTREVAELNFEIKHATANTTPYTQKEVATELRSRVDIEISKLEADQVEVTEKLLDPSYDLLTHEDLAEWRYENNIKLACLKDQLTELEAIINNA